QFLIAHAGEFINAGSFNPLDIEAPKLPFQARNCVSDGDQAVELLEHAIDQGAVRPRAAVRDVKVIAPGLSLEPGRPIGSNAAAKSAVGAAKFSAAAGLLRKLLVAPSPVDQHTHGSPPICRCQTQREQGSSILPPFDRSGSR